MLKRRIQLSSDAMFQEIGGEGVILDLKTASYFGLNELGTRVWLLLQQEPDLEVVHARLLAEYDVPSEDLADDLRSLVDRLCEAGLASAN